MNERVQKGTEAEPRGSGLQIEEKTGSEAETRWLEIPQLVKISMCGCCCFFVTSSFQVREPLLGIWGFDTLLRGTSAVLLSCFIHPGAWTKKSLPLL